MKKVAQSITVGLFHLLKSHPRVPLRTKSVAMSAEGWIEKRSDDLGDCLLDHSIQYGWDSQRTLSSGGFWNHHPQHPHFQSVMISADRVNGT